MMQVMMARHKRRDTQDRLRQRVLFGTHVESVLELVATSALSRKFYIGILVMVAILR